MTLYSMQGKLRRANKKNYFLYIFCNFIAMMLITAYTAMMMSPTVLNVLPEGGDSRKQMMAVFVLACVGCTVFTIYGCSLFFRMKAKEIGLLMALGAGRNRLAGMVMSETALISSVSALAGTICGIPFAWVIWRLFRLFIVDSEEMLLRFNYSSLLVSLAFILFIVGAAFLIGWRYLKKTNIIDVLHEEHKNEPVPEIGRLGGPIGIVLLLGGAVCGYTAPSIYMQVMSAYPPVWINILYIPVFIGLYLILLHTIVHGWKKKKNIYKGIISRSMMKFQGKQTVNNMLVVAVLVAGAIFGLFYIPVTVSGMVMELGERPYSYMYKYPGDANGLSSSQVSQIADQHGLSTKDWNEAEFLTLAMDGMKEVEDGDRKYHEEYDELVQEGDFLSQSAYNAVTGQNISVESGTYYAVSNEAETADLYLNLEAEVLTNMVTREKLSVRFEKFTGFSLLLNYTGGTYVLSDEDYQKLSAGLTDDWKGNLVFFNVEEQDSYEFAKDLFYTLIESFGDKGEVITAYDRVISIAEKERGEVYWGDTDRMTQISYQDPDSSEFRGYWKYMPKFSIMDKNDLLKNMAVFFMMFLFIAIICIVASMIICYTRCITIAANNGYVFKDLRRLGGSSDFLRKEIKGQAVKVFAVPYAAGAGMMCLLYTLILYGNDGRITIDEVVGLAVSFGIVVILTGVVYLIYHLTTKKMQNMLV